MCYIDYLIHLGSCNDMWFMGSDSIAFQFMHRLTVLERLMSIVDVIEGWERIQNFHQVLPDFQQVVISTLIEENALLVIELARYKRAAFVVS